MTPAVWLIASAVITLLLLCAAAIVFDVWLVQHGYRTISRRTIDNSRRLWVKLAWLGLFAAFLFGGGALCGHLFFGQQVPCACCKCEECSCPQK